MWLSTFTHSPLSARRRCRWTCMMCDVNRQNSSPFVFECISIVIAVCAHTRTWQTRAGFRMVAMRQTHTILLRLQQSPKSINIYNLLSAKWFFGRAHCRLPPLKVCTWWNADQLRACACAFISAERMYKLHFTDFRIYRFLCHISKSKVKLILRLARWMPTQR